LIFAFSFVAAAVGAVHNSGVGRLGGLPTASRPKVKKPVKSFLSFCKTKFQNQRESSKRWMLCARPEKNPGIN